MASNNITNNILELHLGPASAKCTICSRPYSEPVMLPCLHSFCKACINNHVEQNGTSSSGTILCPSCTSPCQLPSGGVASLPTNRLLAHKSEVFTIQQKVQSEENVACERCRRMDGAAVSFCCSCCLLLCSVCRDDHQWSLDTENHELLGVGKDHLNYSSTDLGVRIPRKRAMCSLHKEEIKSYCSTCMCLICRDCIMIDHRDHDIALLEDASKVEKANLDESITETSEIESTLEATIVTAMKVKDTVLARKDQVNKEITEAFDGVRRSLCDRERVVHQNCEEIAACKLTLLSMQIEDLEKLRNAINFSAEIVSDVQHSTAAEMLSTSYLVQEHIQKVIESSFMMHSQPCEDDVMALEFDVLSAESMISQLGSVSVICDIDCCTVEEGLAIPLATVGRERLVRVALRNGKGQLVKDQLPVVAWLEDKGNGSVLPAMVVCKDGYASISFTPEEPGEHQLNIKVKNKPIPGSPFKLWSRQGRNFEIISSCKQIFPVDDIAYGVAVHLTSGDVYATTRADVLVFSRDGTRKCIVSSEDGKFRGLTIIGDVLFVIDYANRYVLKYSLAGEFLGQFNVQASEDNPSKLLGICTNGKGQLLVTDDSTVHVFTTAGEFISSFPTSSRCYDIAVDNAGLIYTTHFYDNNVDVCRSNGQLVRKTPLCLPTGIAVDDNGLQYICEVKHRSVTILNSRGELVKRIQVHSTVFSIALDVAGDIYVGSGNTICKY